MTSGSAIWRQWCQDREAVGPSGAVGEQDSASASALGVLVTDLWRINQRASREGVADSVLTACERALDDARELGLTIETYVNSPYFEELRVKVLDHEGGNARPIVAECVSPAVFYQGKLLVKAQVITRGENE